jgi:hypothetical protein
MSTVGQKLLALRDAYLTDFSQKETRIEKEIFELAYADVVLGEKKKRFNVLRICALDRNISDIQKIELAELEDFLDKEKIKTLHGALKHIFDIIFATFGRDNITLEESQLTFEQKSWVASCYQNLKADLLTMHQRITLQTLEYKKIELPENISIQLGLQELANANPLAKRIQETLEQIWIDTTVEIDAVINRLNPQLLSIYSHSLNELPVSPSQMNIVVVPSQPVIVTEPQPVFSGGSYGVGVYPSNHYGHGYHHHQNFLWGDSRGWDTARHHYHNHGLYSHGHSGVNAEFLHCCKSVCIDDLYFRLKVLKQCDSCGGFNCSSCSPVSCSQCHNFQCNCGDIIDSIASGVGKIMNGIGHCCENINCNGCCNAIGDGISWVFNNIGECCKDCGSVICRCLSSCPSPCEICNAVGCNGCPLPDCSQVCDICRGINCNCNCDCGEDAGKAIVGFCGALFTGIAKIISSCCGKSNGNTPMDYSSSSTGMAGPNGLNHSAFEFRTRDALSTTGVAYVSSSSSAHTVYLHSTASEFAGTLAYFGIAGPHILRAAIVPAMHIKHGYKTQQSKREIAASVVSALTCFLACYFPAFGGPHAAAVFSGAGFIGGSQAAKVYGRTENRLVFNGETNPEKWLLKSDVLKSFSEMGVAPQELVQLIFTLRDVKIQGANKTNNQGYGAYRLLRFLGYLFDCLKDQQELLPDDIMKLLREQQRESAFGLMRNQLKMFVSRSQDLPGPDPVRMPEQSRVITEKNQQYFIPRDVSPPPRSSM